MNKVSKAFSAVTVARQLIDLKKPASLANKDVFDFVNYSMSGNSRAFAKPLRFLKGAGSLEKSLCLSGTEHSLFFRAYSCSLYEVLLSCIGVRCTKKNIQHFGSASGGHS